MRKKWIATISAAMIAGNLVSSMPAVYAEEQSDETVTTAEAEELSGTETIEADDTDLADTENSEENEASDKEYIEALLNLKNNESQTWTYNADSDSWTLSVVSAVAYPELPDQQGVSVCVPGAYVAGIDTDGDGAADVTAENASEEGVQGSLVIDYDAEITSSNGQTYTASTAPVILNTGAAGYGSQSNQLASSTYASEGYINVACGNRGKQDSYTDENGETVYTGDSPSCLVDQKNAARFVKYNILLGNLPGSVDFFVSTGGSGGGAHATMFAATSNNEDFYDYEIEAGAVGVYQNEDGSYSTTVTIDGNDYEISDGAWGCVAYSAITSLAEADMAMAFEYFLDTDYSFNTSFQQKVAEYLSQEYMEYINAQNLTVQESAVGFDLNSDGDTEDEIALTIEYDEDKYADTNGYGGTYLDLYLAEFIENLQWYLDNLDYAEGWTWFDADGNALSDEDVTAMTTEDKATAFLEGRVAAASTRGGMGGPGGEGGFPGGRGNGEMRGPGGEGGFPGGDMAGNGEMRGPGGEGGFPGGDMSAESEGEGGFPQGDMTGAPEGEGIPSGDMQSPENAPEDNANASGSNEMIVGTPDEGTTQSASGGTDSNNYSTYDELLAAYEADIAEVQAGDRFGNNQVDLYNPLNYIGAETTENPTWVRIVMGASEGDMSMFSSLNLQIAMLASGIDAEIEWQWNGGHVPSEIFGNSLSLYVDQMYGEYVEGAAQIEKAAAEPQTENGTAESATGTDMTSWVNYDDISNVSVTLADAVSYRTNGASKATPGFDVIDYGQEDYVFGSETQDARHWDSYLLKVLKEHAEELSELFNS